MIDAKLLRSDTDRVRAALARRGAADEVDAFLELDGKRRTLLASVEQSRADANAAGKEIGAAKKEGRDTTVAIADFTVPSVVHDGVADFLHALAAARRVDSDAG